VERNEGSGGQMELKKMKKSERLRTVYERFIKIEHLLSAEKQRE